MLGYIHYIQGRNKIAAAKILQLDVEAIIEVVEYADSYYVKIKKGFGRSTFISKGELIIAKGEINLMRWMDDFKKRNIDNIHIGTEAKGLIQDFGVLNFTNLELALYEYRKGITTTTNDDRMIIGSFDKWKNYKEVDSYQFRY
ncbi:MAG: hypothetical protein ACKPCP_15865 [Sphaerospermopsis kisseleviana]